MKSLLIALGLCLALPAMANLPSVSQKINLVTGQTISVEWSNPKKMTVVAFLSVLCPCSNHHLPSLNQIAEEYETQGFNFIGVHSNKKEDIALSRDYFKSKNMKFPVIEDDDLSIANYFDAYKTPHVFIVDHKMEKLFAGGMDNTAVKTPTKHYLRDALAAIRQGKSPPVKNPLILGCVIHR
jgi:peroxiredoxin